MIDIEQNKMFNIQHLHLVNCIILLCAGKDTLRCTLDTDGDTWPQMYLRYRY